MDDPGGGAPGADLTFAWLGEPLQGGDANYYSAFTFCNATYGVGDHVYLMPDDPRCALARFHQSTNISQLRLQLRLQRGRVAAGGTVAAGGERPCDGAAALAAAAPWLRAAVRQP